jgi:lipoprotein-anchoring transpeptidase ErfK/SrfK
MNGERNRKMGSPTERLRAGLACLSVALAVILAGTALAQNVGTQIYDATNRKWVDYTPQVAARFYRIHGHAPEEFRRQVVQFRTAEKPGTIIIDGDRHFLYLVLPDFQAIRYGIGVGREGFGWAGIVKVGRKQEWPTWTPPKEMIERDPDSAKWANGMPGGPDNPLGARALYLYEGNRDSIYRIHGTNQPWSIGLNISSGCIRMNNDDVTDLYSRVEVGAKVIVLMQGAALYKGV